MPCSYAQTRTLKCFQNRLIPGSQHAADSDAVYTSQDADVLVPGSHGHQSERCFPVLKVHNDLVVLN